MKARIHVHPCADCGTPVDCDGTLEQNHDGGDYHPCDLVDRFHYEPVCESCHDDRAYAASQNDDAWSGGFAKDH